MFRNKRHKNLIAFMRAYMITTSDFFFNFPIDTSSLRNTRQGYLIKHFHTCLVLYIVFSLNLEKDN